MNEGLLALLPHHFRQLGEVDRQPPSLVAGQKLGRVSPAGLVLEMEIVGSDTV